MFVIITFYYIHMQWVSAVSDMTSYQTVHSNDTGGCSFTTANVFNSYFYLLVEKIK
jgi:hypothetical protein